MSAGPVDLDQVDMSQTRREMGQARHAPGVVYSSPELLAREKHNLFARDWLFVAREEELPKPGDFLTMDIVGEPIVISRDQAGQLHAFANSCLHRGVAVAKGRGNAKGFSCPYHAWAYDSAGRLIGAPHMDEIACFNKRESRLKPLGLRVWKGNLMVTLDPQPIDFEDFIAPFAPAAEFTHPELCTLAHTMVIKFPCNWKMCVENVLDFYHVGVVHRRSLGRAFALDWEGSGIRLEERGAVLVRFNQGYPTRDGQTLFGRLPWLTPEDEKEGVAGQFYLEPNFLISAAPDMIRLLSFWPTSPTTTDLIIRMLIPRERKSDPDLAAKIQAYADYSTAIFAEDTEIMASLQRAAASDTYQPGLLAKLEAPVRHVMNYLLSRGLAAAEPRQPPAR